MAVGSKVADTRNPRVRARREPASERDARSPIESVEAR